jgi:hypothetical protein
VSSILQSLLSGLTVAISYVPKVVGALLVLLIGYLIARLLRAATRKLLQKFRFDERMKSGHGGEYVERFSPQGSPSRLIAAVIFVVVMVFVLSSTIGTLDIPALTGFMALVLGYLPRVLAALLIFVVAAAVAGLVKGLAQRALGDTPTGRIVSSAAPMLVMAIAVFMALTQLQIAPVIVTVTYTALIGSLALGAAIAFGLGGREAAHDLITSGYRRARREPVTTATAREPERERAEAGAPGSAIPGQQRGEQQTVRESRDMGTPPGSA